MPPFKSESQKKAFQAKLAKGEISKATFDEWDRDTPSNLPDKVAPRGRPKGNPALTKPLRNKKVSE